MNDKKTGFVRAAGDILPVLVDAPKTFTLEEMQADFLEWSGGETPNQMEPEQLETYVHIASPPEWNKDELGQVITDWNLMNLVITTLDTTVTDEDKCGLLTARDALVEAIRHDHTEDE